MARKRTKTEIDATPKAPRKRRTPAVPEKPVAVRSPRRRAAGAARSLIIVESPSKAKTINKYVGRQYEVMASVGHVKDLPESRLGVDLEHDFEPEYVVIKGKKPVLDAIKAAARSAERIFLAPDPDREGEAIAWHIAEELNGDSTRVFRVLFNEITERAIKRALETPSKVDLKKVNAQQARRVLDRIVGYKISPLLWDKVRRGLSAGRVQSVAVRLVCERERARDAFVTEEYWTIAAQLSGAHPPPFEARLLAVDGQEVSAANQSDSDRLVESLRQQEFVVQAVEKRDKRRNPAAPFITSRLQQDAARKLGFSPKKTMALAQQLYEGVELGAEGPVGLITYMRTDSTRIAAEALDEARGYIRGQYGDDYLPPQPNIYRTKKDAQDAHEAIRPTAVGRTPEQVKSFLTKDQLGLYRLIWNRFVASQMNPALLEMTRVDIAAGPAQLRATGSVVKFPGFTTIYTEAQEEDRPEPRKAAAGTEAESERDDDAVILPPITVGERLRLLDVAGKQHFTQPPPRYTEALLIKELEEQGIGRPSTYHTILSTIVERKYVEKIEGRLRPTELGKVVTDLLVEHFPDILNVQFTARMEAELDEIEDGEKSWVETVRDFFEPFSKRLEKAQAEMRDVKREATPTEITCEKCGRQMVIKWGRHGRFVACPGYPECRNTKEFVEKEGRIEIVEKRNEVDENCPTCSARLVLKSGRFGRFLACSGYPECKFTKPVGTGVRCPQPDCGGELVERRSGRGRVFFGCGNYPKCTFASWDRPVAQPCPQCQKPFLVEKFSRAAGRRIVCPDRACGYQEDTESVEVAAAAAAGTPGQPSS